MAVWIHMCMYYTNVGMLGITVCLCLIVWDGTVSYGNVEGLLRCCEYSVDFSLTEILLRLW